MNTEDEIPVTLSEAMDTASSSCICISRENGRAEDRASSNRKITSKSKARKRIRKVGSVPYSTDLQRRRRAELLALRLEAQDLEDQLARLQQPPNEGASTSVGETQTEERKTSSPLAIERKGRQLSESMNRELKAVMAQRLHALDSIQKLLVNYDIRKDIEFVFESEKLQNQSSTAYTAEITLAELTKIMDWMYLQASAVFPEIAGRFTTVLTSNRKCHEIYGNLDGDCIETISITPMPCTIIESRNMLWYRLVSRKSVEPDKLYRFIRTKHGTSLELSCTLPLRDEDLQILYVDAVSVYRMYEEPNRFILVGKTIWLPRAGGLSSKHVTGQSFRRRQAIHKLSRSCEVATSCT